MRYDTEAEIAEQLTDSQEAAEIVEDDADDAVALKIQRSDV